MQPALPQPPTTLPQPSNDPPVARARTLALVALASYVIVLLAVAAYRAREDQLGTSDFDDFWLTGRHFLKTGEWTDRFGVHNYPPFFAFLVLTFAALPLKVASVIFNLVGMVGAGWCAVWFHRPIAEPANGARARAGWGKLVILGALVLPYATACIVMGQLALLTLTMLLLAWLALARGRDARGAFWLGLAISTKVYPAVLVPWLALKHRWQALGWLLLMLVVMNAGVPTLLFGPARAWELHRAYGRDAVEGNGSLRLVAGDSDKLSYANQSLAVVLRRLTQPLPPPGPSSSRPHELPHMAPWDRTPVGWGRIDIGGWSLPGIRLQRAQWLLLGMQGTLTLMALWVARHPAHRTSPERQRAEFAAFVVLGLLLSPILWTFYFVCCYPALVVVAGDALNRGTASTAGRRWAWFSWFTLIVWLAAALALASPLLRHVGFHWVATLVLFVATLRIASRLPVRSATLSGTAPA